MQRRLSVGSSETFLEEQEDESRDRSAERRTSQSSITSRKTFKSCQTKS